MLTVYGLVTGIGSTFSGTIEFTPREIGMKNGVDPPLGRIASTGTDDGFTKEGAACGYSIVAVAQQMIADRNNEKVAAPYQRVRRNSKSLPASPQGSPKLLRKNPYFTNIFSGSSEGVHSEGIAEETKSTAFSEWTSNSKIGRAFSDSDNPPVRTLKAKPSELREMNFWSPTSM